MNNKTQTFRTKGRALFLAAIMVLSVVAMSASFAGSVAALNDASINVQSATVGVDTTNDESTYSIGVEVQDASADGVTNITVDLDDAADFGADQPDLSGLSAGDVSVTSATVDSISTASADGAPTDDADDAIITLDGSVTYSAGTTVDIGLDGVVNPDTPTDDNAEIGPTAGADNPDVFVEFEDTDSNTASDTLADTYSIAPSIVVDVANSDFPRVSNYGAQNVPVSVTIENQGESDATLSEVNFAADDVQSDIIDDSADVVNTLGTGVSIDAGESTTLDTTVDVENSSDGGDYGSLINASTTQNIFHGIQVVNAFEGGAAAPLAVGTNSDGKFTVQVFDDNSDPVANTDVELWLEGDFDTEALVIDNQTTNAQGRVTFSGLAVGDSESNAIRYTARAAEDDPRFSSTTTTEELYEPTRTSAFSSVTVERLVFPDEIDIVQSSNSATANFDDGEGDTIVFEVTVTGDDGQPFGGATVNVTHDGEAGSITFVQPNAGTSRSAENTTTGDGTTTFEVGSDTAQNVDFTFTVEPVDPEGQQVTETRTKSFVLAGDGYVTGEVRAIEAPPGADKPIQNANVWTHPQSTVERNLISIDPFEQDIFAPELGESPKLDATSSFPAQDDTLFFRVVDNDTGEILDVNNDYRIVNGETDSEGFFGFGSADEHITRAPSLNTSDAGVGNGFAVADDRGGSPNFGVIPFEPGNYTVQASETAPNANVRSTQTKFVNSSAPQESFVTYSNSFVLGSQHVTVSQNLTLAAAQQRSTLTGQQLWDRTGSFGEWVLSDLFADGQDGVFYSLFASHPEYDTRFADGIVTEDEHNIEFQDDNAFVLYPIDVEPGFVNVTNFGVHPPLEQTGGSPDLTEIDEFDDKSDAVPQDVPRDASVDVLRVETRNSNANGNLVNATVDITVPDDENFAGGQPAASQYNFSGQVVGVLGGEEVDDNVIHTGDEFSAGGLDLGEGEAFVLLETDETAADLSRVDADNDAGDNSGPNEPPSNETGVFAQLTNDRSAFDFTNKSFLGVVEYDSGSITGDVTRDDEPLPETFVWTREIADNGGNVIIIEPDFASTPGVSDFTDLSSDDDVRNLNFTISYNSSATVGFDQQVTVNGSQLRNVDLADRIDEVSAPGVDDFNLLRFTTQENAQYSMDRVPAQELTIGGEAVDYPVIEARQYNTGERGLTDDVEDLRPGFTSNADITIPSADPLAPEFTLSNLTPQTATVNESEDFDVSVDVENQGNVGDTQDIQLEIVNDSTGTVVVSETQSVNLAAGANDTVTFENVNVSDAGDYTHTVSSDDDSASGSLTVEEPPSSSNWWDPYTDDNGVVTSSSQIFDAIDAFENGELDSGQVFTLIESFETGTPVPDLINQ